MSDDLLDALIGWLFAAVAAAAAMVGAAGTEPAAPSAPAPAVLVQEAPNLDDTPASSVAEGLSTLGYLPCDTPTGPNLPCFWDGDSGPYVVDTLGGVIPLEANQ